MSNSKVQQCKTAVNFCTNLIHARNQSSGSCEGGEGGADGRASVEEPSGWWNVPDRERFLGFTMSATWPESTNSTSDLCILLDVKHTSI